MPQRPQSAPGRGQIHSAALTRRVSLVTFMGGLGGGLVFPILPALGLSLGISGFMIGLILSANRIARLIFDSPAGHAVDRLGGRRTLAGGLFLDAIGVLCYSGALHIGPPVWWLMGGRILFGIGSAFLFVGAQATVLGATSLRDRGRRTATVRIALSAGMPAGLIMGGVISDLVSDNAAFLTGASLSLVGALLAVALIPPGVREPLHGEEHMNLRQAFVGLTRSPHFVFIAASWGFNCLVFLTMQGMLLATLVVLVQQRGFESFGLAAQGTAGLVMAVLMACSSAMAFLIGRAVDRLPLRASLVPPALIGMAAGFVVLGLSHTLWLTYLGAALVGLSYNGVNLPMLALLGDVTRRNHGKAVGFYQLFGDVGGSLGPLVGLEAGLRFGMTPLYLAMAVLAALGIVPALALRAREKHLNETKAAAREHDEHEAHRPREATTPAELT